MERVSFVHPHNVDPSERRQKAKFGASAKINLRRFRACNHRDREQLGRERPFTCYSV